MQNRIVTAVTAILILALGLSGCGGSKGESDSGGAAGQTTEQAAEPKLPEVTVAEAEEAMSDAMLVSALSLFLAFGAEEGDTSVSNEDGSLTLAWGEDADFNTGVGLYTITLADYTVPADDPFGADYNGYILNGTVVMGSTDGVNSTLEMDLVTSHDDAENFPVQSIEMLLESMQNDAEQMPTGYIRINGHDSNLEDLAKALQLGED